MHIHFTGHGLDVTPGLKAFTQEKFKRLERHFPHITSIHVVFHVEKLDQIAEATLLVVKGELHARATADEMYTAIDELVDKLNRQLIKHKEKTLDHRE
jgi:putative sigma-54 modulation protein